MPSIPIKVKTTRQYVNGGPENMIHTVERKSSALAYHYAQRVEGGAKHRVHVITGRLKGSIHRQRIARYQHRVIVGAYYGVYENYGTRYRPPHPFWEPAIRDARVEYDKEKFRLFRP